MSVYDTVSLSKGVRGSTYGKAKNVLSMTERVAGGYARCTVMPAVDRLCILTLIVTATLVLPATLSGSWKPLLPSRRFLSFE
jgi:hypothetical protein